MIFLVGALAHPMLRMRLAPGAVEVEGLPGHALQGGQGAGIAPDGWPALVPAQGRVPLWRTDWTPALTRYAHPQRHAVGTADFPRVGGSAADAAKACARSTNPNAAQLQFLASGGPQQDPLGMDPDGDGFVCGWTPATQLASQL